MAVLIGAAMVAASVLLGLGLLVTHQPAPDPYDQPHREVVPWP